MLDEADLAAAKWCWENNHVAGRGADTLPGAKWLFQPMRTGRGPLGVVGIIRDEPGPLLTPDQQRLLDALADQAALAIERITLAHDLHQARLQAETDRLRSALLTSISHDLRTPLASILGSATSLRSQHAMLDDETRAALLATIIEEADRLNRFIGNLLDMTRLESGALQPRHRSGRCCPTSSARRCGGREDPGGTPGRGRPAADLPMLRLDMVLFEQVLFNLLDNAAKYAPPGSPDPDRGGAGRRHRHCCGSWTKGRHPARRPRPHLRQILSGQGAGPRAGGHGPGSCDLPRLCRGHGRHDQAANRTDRSGAVFTITLPVPADAPRMDVATEETDA